MSAPAKPARIGATWRESTPEVPKPPRGRDGRPNIVVILLDDVGFSDLSCYGSEIPTPAFDRLASEGLAYSNFHVTAMCSPTRACLLTGRNAHKVGMGMISEWPVGYPGYRGYIDRSAATLAEVLRGDGYATSIIGKWHLTPKTEINPTGPFDQWPLGRGFDRWYGFHTSFADHWRPDLTEDNRFIDAPSGDGYFLTTDMADKAIGLIHDYSSNTRERPFFMYVAPGACHWPHHAPKAEIDRFRGQYDEGWDAVRRDRLSRQRSLSVVPEDTMLPRDNPDVPPWDSLTPVQQRFAARLQEAYAAFLSHTDAQVGRILDALDATEQAQDTLVIALSDNGASPEGGPVGTLDNRKHRLYETETDEDRAAGLEDIGSADAFNHYPLGWAQVSNTPLKWYKKDTHGGGVRSPLIMRWPKGLWEANGWRRQFHHVVDLMPTILDILDLDMPDSIGGVPQMGLDGTSMRYSFAQADAPTTRRTQYFELFGDRALWHEGWKAVTHHVPGTDFDDDQWELYDLENDFSETRDLAQEFPETVAKLEALWWDEARRNHVLPLDDREAERIAGMAEAPPTDPLRIYPQAAPISRMALPDMSGPWRISADLTVGDRDRGVILAMGGQFAGYTLFLTPDGRPAFDYRFSRALNFDLTAPFPLSAGRHRLGLSFDRNGTAGHVSLTLDGTIIAARALPKLWTGIALLGALHCGRDPGHPVSTRYAAPFPFTGRISEVAMDFAPGDHGMETARWQEAMDAQ